MTEHPAAGVDRIVSAVVRALVAAHGVKADDVAAALGISRVSYYSRINCVTPWLVRDLTAVADYFGVTPADLLGGNVRVAIRVAS